MLRGGQKISGNFWGSFRWRKGYKHFNYHSNSNIEFFFPLIKIWKNSNKTCCFSGKDLNVSFIWGNNFI